MDYVKPGISLFPGFITGSRASQQRISGLRIGENSLQEGKANPRVFFDLDIGSNLAGTLVIELFIDTTLLQQKYFELSVPTRGESGRTGRHSTIREQSSTV
ncbi:hypothetical protein Dsin_022158 [Dipteronia sinensis]|uniref:Uncharacterized protein n=1 Tax=Dipteronia sinensis TaxID=43782 RepID=A0AAE0DZI8_9ROSI|nr:hypothetical protein Dsin_022158 [Dipteronia sinensis]